MAAVATVLCGTFFAASVATFAGAVVLVRRARRVEETARAKYLEALDVRTEAARARDEAQAALEQARRLHADCRARVLPVTPSPLLGRYLGLFGRLTAGVA